MPAGSLEHEPSCRCRCSRLPAHWVRKRAMLALQQLGMLHVAWSCCAAAAVHLCDLGPPLLQSDRAVVCKSG